MDTKNFLTRVFAQQNELVICTHKPDPSGKNPRGFFWNRGSYTDLDLAVADISLWDKENDTTIYFTIGSFANHAYTANGRQKWYRTQEHAKTFKTLALDLDIGADKPYATQKEGWTAMSAALNAIGMPAPMVISSGNGIHLYWPLTEAISKEHWVRVSTALRVALEKNNVQIDTTKIHDPSMVLRPVGTHHKKQKPWKEVKCIKDCPDYDPMQLFTILKPWFGKATKSSAPQRGARPKSSILAAVLKSNDVNLEVVAQHCGQIRAMLLSGGVTDAAGNLILEPMWRLGMGMAAHAIDVQAAVVMLAGKHPDFDLQTSMDKVIGWKDYPPTTCEKFEQVSSKGCEGCPHRGKIRSPAQLSSSTTSTVVVDSGEEVEITLPQPYVEKDGKIYKEIKVTVDGVDANGAAVQIESTEWDLISPYPMHITGIYKDNVSTKSTFRLAIKYPLTGWQEEDHEIAVLASIGKDFSAFMLNRQVYSVKGAGHQEKLRGYLMDYLTSVQSLTPTGLDYIAFGWQPDGSFLCGEKVLGSPTGSTDRRLRGPAARFANIIKMHGTRAEWVEAMEMLNLPGTQTIRAGVLIGTVGIIGEVAGNSTMLVSIYSPETTTGKTLALLAANSLIGTPKVLLMSKNDTANALFKTRGVLNSLPCTIDELTTMLDQDAADLAYDLSQGREKIAMTKDRELREPVTWAAPTMVTSNFSMHQKFENVQSNNDPLKARTLELPHDDRIFITTDETGSSNGYRFFDMIANNNGWAFPELVEAVIAMGGPKVVWEKGEKAFFEKFGFIFEPQERFYRTGIISAWTMGKIGKKLGLFPFDVDATTQYLIEHVRKFRNDIVANKQDVFDVVGQFLQEHNDQLIEVTEVYGTSKEQVHIPAPERAVARLKVVYDSNNPVMPGSQLAINLQTFKKWLNKYKDSSDRIVKELEAKGGLIAPRERVTIFKGCQNRNPGQAHCIIVNINHPRFIETLTSTTARLQSPVALAVLQGGTN